MFPNPIESLGCLHSFFLHGIKSAIIQNIEGMSKAKASLFSCIDKKKIAAIEQKEINANKNKFSKVQLFILISISLLSRVVL